MLDQSNAHIRHRRNGMGCAEFSADRLERFKRLGHPVMLQWVERKFLFDFIPVFLSTDRMFLDRDADAEFFWDIKDASQGWNSITVIDIGSEAEIVVVFLYIGNES